MKTVITPRELFLALFLVKGKVNLRELREMAEELERRGIEVLGDLMPEVSEFVMELKAFGLAEVNGEEVTLKLSKVPVELLEELHSKIGVIERILKEKTYMSTTN